MAHLQRVVTYNNTLNEQVQDRLLLRQRRVGQPAPDPRAEGGQIGQHLLGLGPLLAEPDLLRALRFQPLPTELQLLAPFGQFRQADDLGLVGIDQPALLAIEPGQPGRQVLGLGLLVGIAVDGQGGKALELGQQSGRVGQQPGHMRPDRRLQFLGLDRPPGQGVARWRRMGSLP